MAGLNQSSNEESYVGLTNSAEFGKKKDNSPSSYFMSEFSTSSKKGKENQQHSKSTGLYIHEEPSTSGRKVCVNVSTHGGEKKTEIAVTSSFSSRKKVDNSTQSDRNIVGQEQSPPKERKKWVRPPVVGQASNFDLPPVSHQQTSSDSELEKKKPPKLHLSLGKSTSYFDKVPQKPVYSVEKECLDSQKDDISSMPDNNECNRAPSPASASSLTSRPLEWDSGADVGYNNIFNSDNDQRLSTIEKLALVQGTAIIFQRSDPEGTTGNVCTNPNIKIAPPVAESTPKNVDQLKSDSDSDHRGRSMNKKDRNTHHLFPEVMIKTIGVVSPSTGSLSPEVPSRCQDMNIEGLDLNNIENKKKIVPSFEGTTMNDNEEEQSSDFSRSHSQSNIPEEINVKANPQRYDSAKSRSSSSVSTVVTKKNHDRNSLYKKGNLFDNASNKDSDENHNDSSNPPLVSNRHLDNNSRHTSPQGTDQFNTLESGPLTGEARVNSFEYLPGHVYENSVAKVGSDSSSRNSEEIWNAMGNHSTFKDDIERGANLMAEFIRSSKAGEDAALKKQLVRRVVEKLINSDYPDDESVKSLRLSSGRGANVMIETRGQISGESSTEKSDINQTQDIPSKVNKCVGTGISTSLSGYTETSEWNSATESSKKYSSDCVESNFSGRCKRSRSKLDKMTQVVASGDSASAANHSDKKDSTNSKEAKVKRKGEEEMLMYLQKERRNQLHWIKSEIDHLSNLKILLEKHEKLKKNLDQIKKNRQTLEQPLKSYSENVERSRKSKFKRVQMESKSAPVYLNSERKGRSLDSASSSPKEAGWMSHNYDTEDERIKKENIEPIISGSTKRPSRAISDPLPRATSYTITFPYKSASHINKKTYGDDDIMLSVGELKTAINEIVERHRKPAVIPSLHHPSLKDCLTSSRPDYVKKADSRRQILSEIKQLRQQRQDCKPEVIAAAHADIQLAPPPLAVKRVFSQQNLRKQTERKYKQLADVRNKKAELKRKEEYRTNRLMAEKLQRRALQGQVNLSNSVCVTDPA